MRTWTWFVTRAVLMDGTILMVKLSGRSTHTADTSGLVNLL